MRDVETTKMVQDINLTPSSTSFSKGSVVSSEETVTVTVDSGNCSRWGKLFANRWEFWTLLVISIIVALITWWIGGTQEAVNRWNGYTKVTWADNLWVLAVFQLIALLILGWATFMAGVTASDRGNNFNATLIYLTYALQLILLVIACVMIFRQNSAYVGFFFCLGLLLVSVWQFYLFMQSGSQASVWLLILYVIWLLIVTFLAWNVYSHNF